MEKASSPHCPLRPQMKASSLSSQHGSNKLPFFPSSAHWKESIPIILVMHEGFCLEMALWNRASISGTDYDPCSYALLVKLNENMAIIHVSHRSELGMIVISQENRALAAPHSHQAWRMLSGMPITRIAQHGQQTQTGTRSSSFWTHFVQIQICRSGLALGIWNICFSAGSHLPTPSVQLIIDSLKAQQKCWNNCSLF